MDSVIGVRDASYKREVMPSPATVVVVPCFNEAVRLDVAAFEKFFAKCFDTTLLFVDDGSTDDTPLIIERMRQRHPRQVLSYRLGENVGKAEAVRRGMQLAFRKRAALAGYWDADLATPLESISRFRNVLLERKELQLVMGSRVALLGRDIRRRWRRHLLGRAFATAASCVLGLPVYDTQCGAKLFRVTEQTAEVFRKPFASRWIFDVEILSRLIRDKVASEAIYEFPLDRWQEVEGSRLRALDFVKAAVDLAGIGWRHNRPVVSVSMEKRQPEFEAQHREAA